MENRHLKRHYQLIASNPGLQDFIDFLKLLVEETSDIRKPLGDKDSFEAREAITKYLQDIIDKLTKVRNNLGKRKPSYNDDV